MEITLVLLASILVDKYFQNNENKYISVYVTFCHLFDTGRAFSDNLELVTNQNLPLRANHGTTWRRR
mgnify:CR=1 FL=1